MGPQLDSCGRAEPLPGYDQPDDASMGPQLDSCGRAEPLPGYDQPDDASMGPQLDSCGRDTHSYANCRGCGWLQWGRNLIVAEG